MNAIKNMINFQIGEGKMKFRMASMIVACVLVVQAYTFSDITKDFCKEIEGYPAWHGAISKNESETLLQRRKPFTFLLRRGEGSNHFIISYVQPDSSICHKDFIFDTKSMKWFYQNCTGHFEEKVCALIHQMMHCDPAACEII
jgi:hypothetical protein